MNTRLSTTTAAATVLVAAAVLCAAWARPAPALGAPDTTPPTGTLAGLRSTASGTLELLLSASDTGVGLAGAEATLGTASVFVRLGTGSCPEHPAVGTEPPPGTECPASVSAVALALDTRTVPDGSQRLRVRVRDGAGNTATLVDRIVVVRNAIPTSGTKATLTIGVASQSSGERPGAGHGHGHGGAPPVPCQKPKLKMHLAEKPLWRTRHAHLPVLRFRSRHPYRGRLTCLVSGKRFAAPEGTAVQIFYRIWRHTFTHRKRPLKVRKGTIAVRGGGLRVKLGFYTGRTIVFRYRSPAGEVARAKLRIAVARPDPPMKERR